jgi:hypothetical protein
MGADILRAGRERTMSLRSLHRRLDGIRGPEVPLTVRDAIDRPPHETKEQWIARTAAQAEGRPYFCDAVNSYGETRARWEARRMIELSALGGQYEAN